MALFLLFKSRRKQLEDDNNNNNNNPLFGSMSLSKFCVGFRLSYSHNSGVSASPFNSLISDDSKFAKKHLSLSATQPTLHRFVVSCDNKGERVLFDTPIPSDFLTSSIKQSILRFPSSLKIGSSTSPTCVSSCDGILCFTMSDGSAVLWNPTIRKSKKLSSLRLYNTWIEGVKSLSTYSFGYDPFIHNYKIVAISILKDKTQVNVYVHTLGSGSDDWRRIQDFPNFSPHEPGIFVNGTVNWLAVERFSTSDRVIVSLDLKNEMYQKIPQPDSDKESSTLGVSMDCLCIFATSRRIGESSRFLDVWIMKEYGNKESWTKLYRVPHREEQTFSSRHREQQSFFSFKNVLYIYKNDQLLMDFFELDEIGSFRKIKLVYHSKTGTLKIADIENVSHWIDPNVYVESLISPCP